MADEPLPGLTPELAKQILSDVRWLDRFATKQHQGDTVAATLRLQKLIAPPAAPAPVSSWPQNERLKLEPEERARLYRQELTEMERKANADRR